MPWWSRDCNRHGFGWFWGRTAKTTRSSTRFAFLLPASLSSLLIAGNRFFRPIPSPQSPAPLLRQDYEGQAGMEGVDSHSSPPTKPRPHMSQSTFHVFCLRLSRPRKLLCSFVALSVLRGFPSARAQRDAIREVTLRSRRSRLMLPLFLCDRQQTHNRRHLHPVTPHDCTPHRCSVCNRPLHHEPGETP